jgi:hypothetical protein
MANERLPDADVRIATGLCGTVLAMELIMMLTEKKILSEDEALTIYTGAATGLANMAQAAPHPIWQAAHNLLRMQAKIYGGPDPRAKPS